MDKILKLSFPGPLGQKVILLILLVAIFRRKICSYASAVMSVTTAKVAGVKNIIACSPPKKGVGLILQLFMQQIYVVQMLF